MTMTVWAQNADLGNLLLRDAPGDYIGQRSDNSKDKTGSGILKVSGAVYIGDLYRNKFNGKGMIVSAKSNAISNTPDAYVYVGGFVGGKKQGKGTCYAPNGDVIYSGKFEKDKPVDPYPGTGYDESRYFSMMETPDGYFIGEVVNGVPSGFGICIQQDGAYWLGSYKDGDRRGVSTFLYGPDEWQVVNYRDGQYSVVSSSDEYQARNNTIKTVNKKVWSDFWSGMAEVSAGLVATGQQYMDMKNSGSAAGADSSGSYSGGGGNASSSSSSHGGAGVSKRTKGADCGTAWMSDSRVYSNYETQLIKGGQSEADRRDIRAKMKRIREKWQSRGCTLTKSPYE